MAGTKTGIPTLIRVINDEFHYTHCYGDEIGHEICKLITKSPERNTNLVDIMIPGV